MEDFFTGLPWSQMGWGAVVLLVVIMIFRGKLVPERHYIEAVAERNLWREAARASEEARNKEREVNEKLAQALGDLLGEMGTITHIIESLPGYGTEGE